MRGRKKLVTNKVVTHHLPWVDQYPDGSQAKHGSTLFFYLFNAEHEVLQHGISFWLVQVIHLVVPPPNLLRTPQSMYWGSRVRNRAGLDTVQALSSNS